MLVLGITGGIDDTRENTYGLKFDEIHDSAAVLTRNGVVVAAIEQERLNRIKHTNKAPSDAIRACLALAGASASDLDAVAYYATEPYCDQVLAQLHLRALAAPRLFTGRTMVQRIVRNATGHELDASRIRFVGHHLAHGVSAFYQSGFDEALVLSLDGQGEGLSGMVFSGTGGKLEPLRSMPEAESLGYLYRDVIRFLGYEMFDEYKVMGMAPYGDPATYRQSFRALYDLLPDGQYRLHLNRVGGLFKLTAPRRKGEPFTRAHQHIAAALQETIEMLGHHIVAHFARATGHRRLCLAGGVAHNCSLNGRLACSNLFEEMFVQPAAHDAGCALGAALAVEVAERPRTRIRPIDHVYWGTDIGSDAEIEQELSRWAPFLSVERPPDICESAARLMADGKVLGWVQGRAEFGPRALGNRSIVADPRPAGHKDLINAMVKKREGYRPFAPSVLEERASEFFVLPASQTRFPYMTVIVSVRPDQRDTLGAITHVDGTARIQTVSRSQNAKYYDLIAAFGRLTGVPIVLNTSFNNHAEPIVDSIGDAITCFLTTDLHHLVAGPYLASKRDVGADDWLSLLVTPAATLTLNARRGDDGGWIQEAAFSYDHGRIARTSERMFDALRRADGTTTLEELMGESVDRTTRDALAMELLDLWTVRMVRLTPRTPNP